MIAAGLAVLLLAPQGPVQESYDKKETMVAMRDGVKLFTAIYSPKDKSQAWPIILCRSPYGSGPYGEDRFKPNLGPMGTFTREKYIYVYQDIRGRYMSEGTHIYSPPIVPNKKTAADVDESTDAYDTIDWLVKNLPNNSGKVGIWGISQPGYYASQALVGAHPALVAASPQAPVTDRFVGDDDHHNGAFFLAQRFSFMAGFGAPRTVPATSYTRFTYDTGGDAYKFFLEMGPLSNAQKTFKNQNLFWNQTMEHETYDSFWKPRGIPQYMKSIRPAVLVIGGWFDAEDLWGAINTYQAIERQNPGAQNFFLMGPWSHGGWTGTGERLGAMEFGSPTGQKAAELQLAFFNYYLKGLGSKSWAEATMFQTGANVWRTFEAWPPKVRQAVWRLAPGGKLSPGSSNAQKGPQAFDQYVSDPASPVPFIGRPSSGVPPTYMVEDQTFAAQRADVKTYVGEPLAEDLTIAGPITADLWVSTSGTDSDWIVKLIDFYPADEPEIAVAGAPAKLASYQMLLRAEVMRGKFRNSLERPEPFIPGRPTRVRFTLNDVLHTFKKGHRLMVQVQSSWFPLVDRNPQRFVNIPKASAEDFQPATQRIYLSAPFESKLVLGVMP